MAFCELHWFSQTLGRQTTTWVLLPDNCDGPFKTIYLLHGLSDDHTIWLRRTRIERHVQSLPLIVVMPDGGRGFYTDHDQGPKWATHIGVELPTLIERTFDAAANRESRFIGGLSMGGYGALRVGLGFTDRFESVSSHSGALMFGSIEQDNPERIPMVGRDPRGTSHDLIQLATQARPLPRIKFDCGFDDFLIESNRSYHAALDKAGVPHRYDEYAGAHDWDYWDEHVKDAIAFHLQG